MLPTRRTIVKSEAAKNSADQCCADSAKTIIVLVGWEYALRQYPRLNLFGCVEFVGSPQPFQHGITRRISRLSRLHKNQHHQSVLCYASVCLLGYVYVLGMSVSVVDEACLQHACFVLLIFSEWRCAKPSFISDQARSVNECASRLFCIGISTMRCSAVNGVMQSQAPVGLEALSLNM